MMLYNDNDLKAEKAEKAEKHPPDCTPVRGGGYGGEFHRPHF
jgi:hypothetical protein